MTFPIEKIHLTSHTIHPDFSEETQKLTQNNTHKFNYLMNSLVNMCEGNYTILDVANHTDLPFRFVENYINLWVQKKLIKKVWKHPFK